MAKGGSFEREMSKAFSLWFTAGVRDDVFWHTQSSGGRATQRKKTGKATSGQHGDMFATDEIGKPLEKAWNVEFKSGYADTSERKLFDEKGRRAKIHFRWDLLDLIDSFQNKPVFEGFWGQARRDAWESGRTPVLVFRRNLRKPCIVFTRKYFNSLVDHFGYPEKEIIQLGKRACLLSLESFFEWIPDIGPVL